MYVAAMMLKEIRYTSLCTKYATVARHPAMDKAMEAATQKLTLQTKMELETPFHLAKWMCFKKILPIKEPLEKLLCLFGPPIEKNLGCTYTKYTKFGVRPF